MNQEREWRSGKKMMEIRTEKASDYDDIFQLHYLAFGNRDKESKLNERIRLSEQFVPDLALVAEENDRVVGHALFSKAEIVDGDQSHDVIVLAPIAVLPDCQKQGIGSKLIHEGLRRCTKLGYDLVFLIGHPTYYPKFGFKPARMLGFDLKQFQVRDDVFMVYEINHEIGSVAKGELRYPQSFFDR